MGIKQGRSDTTPEEGNVDLAKYVRLPEGVKEYVRKVAEKFATEAGEVVSDSDGARMSSYRDLEDVQDWIIEGVDELIQYLGHLKAVGSRDELDVDPAVLSQAKTPLDLGSMDLGLIASGCEGSPLGYLWTYRYLNRELEGLTQDDFPSREGPFIVVLDKSTSMQGRKRAFVLAQAVAIVAARQGRRVVAVAFSDNAVVRDSEKEGLMGALKILAHQTWGGTEYNAALEKVLEVIRDEKGITDVLFITDGEYDEDEMTMALKKKISRLHGRIFGVLVGGGRGLDKVADVMVDVGRLDDQGWLILANSI